MSTLKSVSPVAKPVCRCGEAMQHDSVGAWVCPRRNWFNFWKHERSFVSGKRQMRVMKRAKRINERRRAAR